MDNYENSDGVPSKAALGRHPIHPMLVTLPIGFLVGALVSDIVYAAMRDAFWAQASFWLIAAGIVTALLAAVFGLTDFVTIKRARNTVGYVHLIGNLTVVVLSLVNLLIRLPSRADPILPWGIGLSVIVGLILLLTGWMGGELTFRYKVGVIGNEPRGEPLPAAGQSQHPIGH
jgi:uncharacterized membrane protein